MDDLSPFVKNAIRQSLKPPSQNLKPMTQFEVEWSKKVTKRFNHHIVSRELTFK